jgi:hypothetical protein
MPIAVCLRLSFVLAIALAAPLSRAAEITLLSGGAVEPGLKPVLAAFQTATGHTVRLTFNAAPQIEQRIEAGEAWDVVIAPVARLDRYAQASKVGSERVTVGRVGLGVAIRPGAPVPAVGDADSVKRAIVEADSVVYNRASTGLLIEEMLRRMEIEAQVAPKAQRPRDGAAVMEHLLQGPRTRDRLRRADRDPALQGARAAPGRAAAAGAAGVHGLRGGAAGCRQPLGRRARPARPPREGGEPAAVHRRRRRAGALIIEDVGVACLR